MLRESVIAEVAGKQKTNFLKRESGLSRLARLRPVPHGYVSIVTGVRRCGKSTLMEQRMRKDPADAFYLNLESAALTALDLKDASRLDRVIEATGARRCVP